MELQSWLQMAAGHYTMEQFFASNLRVARHNKALWSISMRKTHGESSLYNENKMATFLKALEVARQLCEQTIQKAVRQMPMWEHKWIAQRTFSWISEM